MWPFVSGHKSYGESKLKILSFLIQITEFTKKDP